MSEYNQAEDRDEYDGPLRLTRVAVPWHAYVMDGPKLSLVFAHSTGGATLSEVVVSERCGTVAITLFRRALVGTFRDGSVPGELLDRRYSGVTMSLSELLGERLLMDGSTGEQPHALEADDDAFKRIGADGCPLWVP